MPTFDIENRYVDKIICGIDEAGLGPLAGPIVVASCVILDQALGNDLLDNINDSKKLSHKKREYLFEIITNSSKIKYATSIINANIIDEIGLSNSWGNGVKESIANLNQEIDVCLIDGNRTPANLNCLVETVIKGDQKSYSIATASIIAKITRDRIMQKIHHEFPEYGFDKHVGYGTKLHMETLGALGPCPQHRKSYAPVANYFSKHQKI